MSDESTNGESQSKATVSVRPHARAKADYEVGYGKPPKATRFKKGQSGNPKGTVNKAKIDDLRIVIESVLAEPVKLRDGKKIRPVSKLEMMLRTQLRNALSGNPKDAKAQFRLAQKVGLFSQAKPESLIVIDPPGNAEERMLLRAFHSEQGADQAADVKVERANEYARTPSANGR